MPRYHVNGEFIEAVSANDAIRVYCDNLGYRPIREPDVHDPDLRERDVDWVDEDGEVYTVGLVDG